jgi:BirA family biotin operon repressor/biotin-[acetyl-CoA-carboxylase] ligase
VNARKVAGVLVEMRARPKAPHIAILGIGLNVNQDLADFSEDVREHATSLAIIKQAQQDRHALAVALLRNLDRTYAEVSSGG